VEALLREMEWVEPERALVRGRVRVRGERAGRELGELGLAVRKRAEESEVWERSRELQPTVVLATETRAGRLGAVPGLERAV
jgi:hypothetical protein